MLLLKMHLVKLVVLYTHEICDCVSIVLRSSALQYDGCFEEENAPVLMLHLVKLVAAW